MDAPWLALALWSAYGAGLALVLYMLVLVSWRVGVAALNALRWRRYVRECRTRTLWLGSHPPWRAPRSERGELTVVRGGGDKTA